MSNSMKYIPKTLRVMARKSEDAEGFLRQIKEDQEFAHRVVEWWKSFNSGNTCSGLKLYHGTTYKNYEEIMNKGFKLTTGYRSGFMGDAEQVISQAIFLSDSYKVADFFADNRQDTGGGKVITVCADFSKVLNIHHPKDMEPEIQKTAIRLMKEWDGIERRKIPQSFGWWLIDQPEFTTLLKDAGYDAVKLIEEIGVRREAGDMNAVSYACLDLEKIKVHKELKNVHELYNYFKNE